MTSRLLYIVVGCHTSGLRILPKLPRSKARAFFPKASFSHGPLGHSWRSKLSTTLALSAVAHAGAFRSPN